MITSFRGVATLGRVFANPREENLFHSDKLGSEVLWRYCLRYTYFSYSSVIIINIQQKLWCQTCNTKLVSSLSVLLVSGVKIKDLTPLGVAAKY